MGKSVLMLALVLAATAAGYAVPGPDSVELTRSATILGAASSPPDHLQVAVTVTVAAGVNVASGLTAFTIQENIPADWNYVSAGASPEPAVAGPDPNTPTLLNFVWVTLPSLASPFTMTYFLTIPSGSTGGEITGQVLYRTSGGTLSSLPVTTSQDDFNCLLMARTVPAQYRASDQVTVTVTLTSYCGDTSSQPLTALGVEETIPAGWSLVSVAGDAGDIQPSPGAQGTLAFGWTTPPDTFPLSFSYVLNVSPDATGNAEINGVVLSRLGPGGELRSPQAQTAINWVPTAVVPDVGGQTEASARAAVEGTGLTVGSVVYQCDNNAPADRVLDQQPAPGTRLDLPGQVDMTVSTGPCPTAVPDLTGLSISAALNAILGAGFQVGTVNQACHDTAPVGTVIGQDPPGGSTALYGSTINLVLSAGPCPVEVPDVTGLARADAETAIQAAELIVGQQSEACSDTVPAGNVIRTNPAAGTQVDPGTVVDLVVSSGPCPTQMSVPDVSGQPVDDARQQVSGAGLIVGQDISECSDTVPAGNVIRTNPAAGTQVDPGTVVDLVVSSGSCSITVPDVIGLAQAAAEAQILAAGLLYTTSSQCDNNVSVGHIISQDPMTGSLVSAGTAVALVISSGPCPAQVSVPDVSGQPVDDARQQVSGAGLIVGQDISECSDTVPEGNVIRTNPAAGTHVDPSTVVDLVVSSGSCGITVPNVIGLAQAAAEAQILAAGLLYTTSSQCDNNVSVGNIISQDPMAGSLVSVGTAVNLVVSSGSCSITVPNVIGLAQAAAEAQILEAGLLYTTSSQCDNNVSVGHIISQDPMTGSLVSAGTAVALVISSGPCPAQVSVPDVSGQPVDDARQQVSGAGLIVGQEISECSDTVPEGNVIRTNPAAGAQVDPGTVVDLVVSSGSCSITVPNVIGLAQAAAEAQILAAGLLYTTSSQCDNNVPVGHIISQDPTAGSLVSAGTAVALVISSGPCPAQVSVPDVSGQPQIIAEVKITGAGLKLGTVTTQCDDRVPEGSVVAQDPAAGTQVSADTSVNLVVSSGPAAVPNVLLLALTDAETAIQAAGLTASSVIQVYSASEAARGLVIRQYPDAGITLPCGGEVNLLVSLGRPEAPPSNREIMQQIFDRFSALDINTDNRLSLEEVLAGPLQTITLEIFQSIDTNNDGSLTREELEDYLRIGGCFGCVSRLFVKDLLIPAGGDLLLTGLGLALLLTVSPRRHQR